MICFMIFFGLIHFKAFTSFQVKNHAAIIKFCKKKGQAPYIKMLVLQNKFPGSVLLSHKFAVPSAHEGLTSEFGMGSGGSPPP